jgi:hypothetical protein
LFSGYCPFSPFYKNTIRKDEPRIRVPVPFFSAGWGKAGAKKSAGEWAPMTFWRRGYLPYFGKRGLFWAYFLGIGKISILRGFPKERLGNGGQFGGIFFPRVIPTGTESE